MMKEDKTQSCGAPGCEVDRCGLMMKEDKTQCLTDDVVRRMVVV